MEQLKTNINNAFPSDMVPMAKKQKKEWQLQFVEAFHRQHHRVIDDVNYQKWKALAEGRQSIDQYKKWVGSRRRAGKKDLSWMNLDYSILPIMPKFVKIIRNKILNEPKEFKIRAIDPYSVNEQRKQRNQIIAYMANRQLNEELKQLGVAVQTPFEDGEAQPNNISEVDLYQDVYPKNRHVNELYDELELAFSVNKWESIERKIIDDLVKVGVMGVWTRLDNRGYIKVEQMKVQRVITNSVEEVDYSDMTRIGEYIPMTIGQIRVLAQKEIARGEITEKDLAEIASKAGNRSYTPTTREMIYQQAKMNAGVFQAPYDHERVQVLRYQLKSTDTLAYVVSENEDGQITIDKRDNPFWLDKNGFSDAEYEAYNKSQGVNRRVERLEMENIYQGYWIVDTKHVFQYGLKPDIQRNVNSLADAEFDAKIYTLDFDSIMRQLEPVIHQAQVNWLKFQHHNNKSIPDGILWNKKALTEITVGNVSYDALDLIDMYVQTGGGLYKDTDANGRTVQMPFQRVEGSKMDRAQYHLNAIFQQIDLIRNILGLNEATDASSINPEQGKAVSEMMAFNTNTAMGDFFYGHKYIYEEVGKSIARLVPDARKTKKAGYIEALGKESQRYWEANSDTNFVDFSISIEAGWDQEKRQSIRNAAQQSLKAAGGKLEPQDVYIIENERNPEKAYLILEAKNKQRKKEELNQSIILQRENAQVQQQSTMMAEQMKQESLALQEQLDQAKHEREMEKLRAEWELKMLYLQMEKGLELDDNQKQRMNDLLMGDRKNQTTLQVARMSKQKSAQEK